MVLLQCTRSCVLNNRDHFGLDVKRNGDHFRVGIISGSIWGSFWGRYHFRVDLGIISGSVSFQGRFGDHFGVGIILGAVQISTYVFVTRTIPFV